MDFLRELIIRLFAKSPLFFRVIKYVSLAVSIITGLPILLQLAGVVLPDALVVLENKAIAIASVVAAFIATLPVEPASVAPALKSPIPSAKAIVNKVSLPFSEKHAA